MQIPGGARGGGMVMDETDTCIIRLTEAYETHISPKVTSSGLVYRKIKAMSVSLRSTALFMWLLKTTVENLAIEECLSRIETNHYIAFGPN